MGEVQPIAARQGAETILGISESWQWPDLGFGSGDEPVVSGLRFGLLEVARTMAPEPLGSSLGSELGNPSNSTSSRGGTRSDDRSDVEV
jgi:hypothetical protein